MAQFLKGKDIVSGQEGEAYMIIDGEVKPMFYVRNLRATVTKQKTEARTLGRRGTQHKSNGWNGTGSMEIFYVTSEFLEYMRIYKETGQDQYFDIQTINRDNTTSVGRQSTTLIDVNLDSVDIAALDAENDLLTQTIPFTFDDFDIGEQFVEPQLGNA